LFHKIAQGKYYIAPRTTTLAVLEEELDFNIFVSKLTSNPEKYNASISCLVELNIQSQEMLMGSR
uniref:Uncharacterized protein n=1 Tax=Amphimedon queenslandica TaxID=400682 RepID=A0A1X7TQH8_AMPQE